MSSSRRLAAPNGARMAPNEQQGLHRCAIALCSSPAVAQGVCSMHLSRDGRAGGGLTSERYGFTSMLSNGGAPSTHQLEDAGDAGDRYYRSGAHMAMQSRGGPPAAKKQRASSGMVSAAGLVPPQANGRPQYAGKNVALTRESLNQHAGNKYPAANVAGGASNASAYEDCPYLPPAARPSMSTTTGSTHSDSEGSMDADKETSLRRERNRIAARKSRQRKLDRISNLEDEKMRLEQHRDMLIQEIRSLEKKDSSVASSAVMTITDKEYSHLQNSRMQIIKAVEDAYNSGDIFSTIQYLRDDSIVSGPQNSSVHLRGKDALVLDYLCTTYLFSDVHLQHLKTDSGGPRSQHFRVHWVFSGVVKSAGVSMNKEFLDLIEGVKGKRVTIEGVSNYSFSGDKIVYVHRTADQAKFLSSLVVLSKK